MITNAIPRTIDLYFMFCLKHTLLSTSSLVQYNLVLYFMIELMISRTKNENKNAHVVTRICSDASLKDVIRPRVFFYYTYSIKLKFYLFVAILRHFLTTSFEVCIFLMEPGYLSSDATKWCQSKLCVRHR